MTLALSRLLLCLLAPVAAFAQAPPTSLSPSPATPTEIHLSRDSARQFFGTYEFGPRFQLRVFSENGRFFAQRRGDPDRFQLFPKAANVFFIKIMPAELEFRRATGGAYQTLVLHQGGQDLSARRLVARPVELSDSIHHLDSLLYQAYNRRDLPTFMAYFALELEFYHDQTGRTDYADNRRRFQENFAKPTRMRRELQPGSLEVYPIAGFGALEIGTHRFYQTEPGQPERLVSSPKFVQVWRKTGARWQLTRVISYDH